MTAKELHYHLIMATKAFGLETHELDLIKVSLDTGNYNKQQIVLAYEDVEYRVKVSTK